ncbi:MAG: urease accessory protein UreD [Gammaproteobacteria bacterium]|jgi:urease accessory protein|nr:urease accessory protein UreD [Gammaproteobacteria bacterium]
MKHMSSRSSWQADLALEFAPKAGKTRLTASHRRGPLAVQRAFFPEGNLNHTYLLHPPGGVVGGDQLDINIQVHPQGQVLLTTPGATKFYRSAGPQARLQQNLHIASGATLEWMPLENIFFPGTNTAIKTDVHLAEGGQFIGWEINCLGRPANDEGFTRGCIDSDFAFYRDGELLLLDRFATQGQSMISDPVGMRGFSAQAMLVATMADDILVEQVQTTLASYAPQIWAGASYFDGLLVVRVLAHQSQEMLQLLTAVWCLLRPEIMGRAAMPPRIWAT